MSITFFPRKDANKYPLDLDGSLRFTRPFAVDIFPYPPIIGMISGFMREVNGYIIQTGIAKTPFGPDINRTVIDYNWQVAVGGLTKVTR